MQLSLVERARRYIAKCPPAVSGQRGHDATFHVAALLWNGFGLSETDTLALLSEYNLRCLPPWSEAELVHKVNSAANAHHTDRRGYLVGDGGGTPSNVIRLPLPPRPPKPRFVPEVLRRVAAGAGAVGDVVAFIMGRSPVPVDAVTSGGFLRLL